MQGAGGGQRFYDRGDPAGIDWTHADLTMDDTWRDLDLSSVVPAGASLVLFVVVLSDNDLGAIFGMRKNGCTNDYNRTSVRSTVVNQAIYCNMLVACDSARIIEYKATVSLTRLELTVAGWWA